jgi:hypothetical protein
MSVFYTLHPTINNRTTTTTTTTTMTQTPNALYCACLSYLSSIQSNPLYPLWYIVCDYALPPRSEGRGICTAGDEDIILLTLATLITRATSHGSYWYLR